MRTTSSIYKELRTQPGSWYVAEINLGSTVYESDVIRSIKINQSLTAEDGPSIGGTVSTKCVIVLQEKSANWPRMASFTVGVRLTDGTTFSELLPLGTFYTDTREENPLSGFLTVTAYDRMLLMEQSWTDKVTLPTIWPITAQAACNLIVQATHVPIDSRSVIDNTVAFVGLDTAATARDTLSTIAAGLGANWIITPDNKLRLVPFANIERGSAAIAGIAVAGISVAGDSTVDGSGSIENAQYLGMYVRTLDVGTPLEAVTGVELTNETGDVTFAGTETGYVLKGECNYSASSVASLCLENTSGFSYMPFSIGMAELDPAAEIGDFVICNGTAYQIMSADWTIGARITAALAAPFDEEVDHEYTVKSERAKTLEIVAKNYSTTVEMNSAIQQTAAAITLSVSQTYETKTDATGKLNTAKTYADGQASTAESNAKAATDQKLTAYSTTVQMNSAIQQSADAINLVVSQKVGNDEIISKINQSAEQIVIAANKLDLQGLVTFTGLSQSLSDSMAGNILPGTDDFYGWSIWSNDAQAMYTIDATNHIVSIIYPTVNEYCFLFVDSINLQAGETYTLSFYGRVNSNVQSSSFYIWSLSDYTVIVSADLSEIGTEWAKIVYTFTLPGTVSNPYRFNFTLLSADSFSGNAVLQIKEVKLEKGNIATEWTPSWNDTALTSGLASGTTIINGGCIQTGTLDASLVNVTNLNASNITSGTLSADRISGGTINAATITVTNLVADNITSGTLPNARIGAYSISGGQIGYQTISTYNTASGINTNLGWGAAYGAATQSSSGAPDYLYVKTLSATTVAASYSITTPRIVFGNNVLGKTVVNINGTSYNLVTYS